MGRPAMLFLECSLSLALSASPSECLCCASVANDCERWIRFAGFIATHRGAGATHRGV